jgi:ppGpp synthetase/RelA/SpoT-type nucleotidyltranferase
LPSGPQKRVQSRTITLPPELWAVIEDRARAKHHGNVSATIAQDLAQLYGRETPEDAMLKRIEQAIREVLARLSTKEDVSGNEA